MGDYVSSVSHAV